MMMSRLFILIVGVLLVPMPLPAAINCPPGFARLSHAQLAEGEGDVTRFRFEPLLSGQELVRRFLQADIPAEQRNPNALWNTHANPTGLRRESADPAKLPLVLSGEEGARLAKLVEMNLKPIQRQSSDDEKWSQVVQSVLISEEKLANEAMNKARELERRAKKMPGGAEAEGLLAQSRKFQQRAAELYWDAYQKFSDVAEAPVTLKRRLSKKAWGDVSASALRVLESALTLEGVSYQPTKIGGTPDWPGYKAIIVDPSPDHSLGRLATGMEKQAKAAVGFSPFPFHLVDGHEFIANFAGTKKPIRILGPSVIHRTQSDESIENAAFRVKQMIEPSENRSPLDASFQRVKNDLRSGVITPAGQAFTGSFLKDIPHGLEQLANQLPLELPVSVSDLQVGSALRGAIKLESQMLDYMREAGGTFTKIEQMLTAMTLSGSSQGRYTTHVLAHRTNAGGIKNQSFFSIVVGDGNKVMGELRLSPAEAGKPSLYFISGDRSLTMPIKGGDLERIAGDFLPLIEASGADKSPKLASAEIADLGWHLLNEIKRNAEVSIFMLLPIGPQLLRIKDAANEYANQPTPETYEHLRQTFQEVQKISGSRLTSQFTGNAEVSKPVKPEVAYPVQFAAVEPSPYLSKRLREAPNEKARADEVGRIGVYGLIRWAHANGYAATDRSTDKVGYDVMLTDRRTGKTFQVEVKARSESAAAKTVSLSWREMQSAYESPANAAIAIVKVADDGTPSVSVRRFEVPHPPDPRSEKTELNIERLLESSPPLVGE